MTADTNGPRPMIEPVFPDVAARHPSIEQEALFDDLEHATTRARQKYVRPKSFAPCPTCPADKVAQELRNGVLTWRAHHRSTIAGRAIMCSTSDTAVDVTA